MGEPKTKLIIALKATPPAWLRILPLGEVTLGDGREPFMVTEASLANILANWERRGNEMVIDYEHQTGTGREAPAVMSRARLIRAGSGRSPGSPRFF